MLSAARQDYAEGKYYDAIAKLQEFLIEGTVKRREKRAYLLMGECYEQLGKPDYALNTYMEGSELNPKDKELLLKLGSLYLQTELTQNSIEAYKKVLDLDPNDRRAFLGLARAYSKEGFFSKAEEYFHNYIKTAADNADNVVIYYEYAWTYYKQRKYNEALFYTALSLERGEENADNLFLAARIHRAQNKKEEAFDFMDKAVNAADNKRKKEEILLTKALWLYKEGDNKGAIMIANQLLKEKPKSQLALFIKYLSLDAQGKKKEAKKYLEPVIEENSQSFINKVSLILVEK
ncbi:tetratricopeptide (TPR) repeat protein [Elusimicrobium posterum]|uniref:tetratricopeptide repeat protein n=1 Tax=Elusimicrobium posterum TaxID=3116653 RepID=UPI003C77A8EC